MSTLFAELVQELDSPHCAKTPTRTFRDTNGNVVMASQEVWIASTSALSINSRYRLPAGAGSDAAAAALR